MGHAYLRYLNQHQNQHLKRYLRYEPTVIHVILIDAGQHLADLRGCLRVAFPASLQVIYTNDSKIIVIEVVTLSPLNKKGT